MTHDELGERVAALEVDLRAVRETCARIETEGKTGRARIYGELAEIKQRIARFDGGAHVAQGAWPVIAFLLTAIGAVSGFALKAIMF